MAVEALELCPATDERIIACALRLFYKLELFWSFGPLLPRAVAAVVDRALVRQQRVTSRMAGLVLGMAATSKHATPVGGGFGWTRPVRAARLTNELTTQHRPHRLKGPSTVSLEHE